VAPPLVEVPVAAPILPALVFVSALPFVVAPACLRVFFVEVIDALAMLLSEAPALALPFWFAIAPLAWALSDVVELV
jgi:hypothetical protein